MDLLNVVVEIVLVYILSLVCGVMAGKLADKYSKKFNGYAIAHLVSLTIFIVGVLSITIS